MDEKILARLEQVERENRRLKRIVLGILVLAGAVLLMGQARPNRTIEAEKFVLKDANGRVRATLGMELTSRPTLALLDEKGFPLVALGAGENPFLNLCKQNCEKQADLALSDDMVGLALYEGGEGWNPLRGERGKLDGLRAGFAVVKGIPGITLFGKDTSEGASLDFETGPRLALNDPKGNVQLGQGRIFLSDPKGMESLGQGGIWVGDKQGFGTMIGSTALETPRTGETHQTSAASIVLYGKDGKTLWSAP